MQPTLIQEMLTAPHGEQKQHTSAPQPTPTDPTAERGDCSAPTYEKFIAAPWGNWVKPPGTVPVVGTYTLRKRSGLLWKVLTTLRYRKQLGGWTNNLGLCNPGITEGLKKFDPETQVLSIAETERGDYKKLVREIPEDFPVELNLSCPNLEGKTLPWDAAEVFLQGSAKRKWCIAKVGPLVRPEELEFLIEKLGFSQIHACNTLRTLTGVDYGAVSGPILVPYVLEIIELCQRHWPAVTVIAGGGISTAADCYRYMLSGAKHISLGSINFNPVAMHKLLSDLEWKERKTK